MGKYKIETLTIKSDKEFTFDELSFLKALHTTVNFFNKTEKVGYCMSSRGGYNLQPNEESRERALEFFVMNKWGIHDINIELDNRGMALLGDGDTRVA